MKSPIFSGTCTALVTPFLDGQVNYPMMEQLLRRQMKAGIAAVVIAGTTGESCTLSDDEKLTLFSRCKEFVGDSMRIIAGTGSNNTEHAVFLSREAEKRGVDGVLVVSPYYCKATEDGLVAHYRAIANAITIPVILYNVPSRTGLDIPVSVCKKLSRLPNVAGIKEAGEKVSKVTDILRECGPDFSVWSGNDELTVPILSLGGRGVISVVSNIIPEITEAMVQAGLDGDFDTAASIQRRIQPLCKALFREVNPVPVKFAMKKTGYDCGFCRLPLGFPSKETEAAVASVLNGIFFPSNS